MVTVSFFVFASTYMITTPGSLIQVGAAELQCSTSCQEELQCRTPTRPTQLQTAVKLSSHTSISTIGGHLGYEELYLILLKRVGNFFNPRHRYLWLAFYSWQLLMITWIWPSLHSTSQTWSSISPTCEKLCFLYPNIQFSAWLHDYKKPLVMQNSKWTGVTARATGTENFLLQASQNNETTWSNIFKALCSVPILNNVSTSAVKSCKWIFSLARACAKHLLLHLLLLRNIKNHWIFWRRNWCLG